ncbi:hypothetical protein KVT40_002678 [Elsinoe batatas]|uniref:DUF6594 domain-containing protein n=1 Tax=Elsinoe batatas TaxID=2601811 RepID=A0A8K0PIS6_9PEZI|nr:hypothetical protein KVT40_002678 [Elsinoe batatas]
MEPTQPIKADERPLDSGTGVIDDAQSMLSSGVELPSNLPEAVSSGSQDSQLSDQTSPSEGSRLAETVATTGQLPSPSPSTVSRDVPKRHSREADVASSESDQARYPESSNQRPVTAESTSNASSDETCWSVVDPYQFLASCVADDLLHSQTIFRRFDQLSIRNLLYLESELLELEDELKKLDEHEYFQIETLQHMHNWPMNPVRGVGMDGDVAALYKQRRDLVMNIRRTLKEYRSSIKSCRQWLKVFLTIADEALRLTGEIFSLGEPHKGDVATLRRIVGWKEKPELGADGTEHDAGEPQVATEGAEIRAEGLERGIERPVTDSRESDIMHGSAEVRAGDLGVLTQETKADSEEELTLFSGLMNNRLDDLDDLCILASKVERDPLTQLLERRFAKKFYDKTTRKTNKVSYKRMTDFVKYFSTFLAVIWLVCAIVALYFWRSNAGRLVLFSVLTLFFALFVALLTTARTHDIYAAIATFAAVLVVFIGTALNQSGPFESTPSAAVSRVQHKPSSLAIRNDAETPLPFLARRASHHAPYKLATSGVSEEWPEGSLMLGLIFLCGMGLFSWRRRLNCR